MSRGFFIPNSVSGNYVSNKRNANGNFQYDQSVNEIGLNQQAAFQTLSKQYNSTINSAYSNYLAANRGIRGSSMGQGYKEAYIQQNQENLQSQVAETNMNVANARTQLNSEASSMVAGVQKQFETEVGNMDRVANSMNTYLGYLKTLTNKKDPSQTYLNSSQMNESLDNMYGTVFQAEPDAYLDNEGNIGMRYIDWVRTKLKDTEADKAWSDWLFNYGGYGQFKDAVNQKGIKPL